MNNKINRKALLLYGTDFSRHPLHQYFDSKHNYDYTNWQRAFSNIFSEVVSYNFVEDFILQGTGAANRKIMEITAEENPDYVLWPSMTFEIMESTLASLRETSNVVAFFFDDLARFDCYSKYYIPYIDYIVTCDSRQSVEKYNEVGINAQFMINGPSRSFFENLDVDEYRTDIVFIGNKIADREIFIHELQRLGFDVAFYGDGWPNGQIPSPKMIELINTSKINLNFTKTYDLSGSFQFKGRIFEVCMCGSFLLTEYIPGIEDYFKIGEEIECFKTKEEMVEKVKYYLEHEKEREKIAAAGYEKTRKLYSLERFFGDIITNIENGVIKKNSLKDKKLIKNNNTINMNKADWYIRSAYGRLMIGKVDQCKEELEIAKKYNPSDKRILAIERKINTCREKVKRIVNKSRDKLLKRIVNKLKRILYPYYKKCFKK
jgi:spore maturation protein CgeB